MGGEQNRWNVIGDHPFAVPDVEFVSQIIDYASSFPNVEADNVSLFGFSDGAGLVNQLLIASDDTRIKRAITDSSQLNALQFRDGIFHVGGPDMKFTQTKATLVPRSLLALQGSKD